MPGKEEWALWCQTAREVQQIARGGQGIERLAATLCETDVEPAANWFNPACDFEHVLAQVEGHAKKVLEGVGRLRRQYLGRPDEPRESSPAAR
jgi:hypothetical protein